MTELSHPGQRSLLNKEALGRSLFLSAAHFAACQHWAGHHKQKSEQVLGPVASWPPLTGVDPRVTGMQSPTSPCFHSPLIIWDIVQEEGNERTKDLEFQYPPHYQLTP